MKKSLIVCFVALGLVFLAGFGSAGAEGEVSFSIRPTKAFPDKPETFAYFSHELTQGARLTDEALVANTGSLPIVLTLYAADRYTAINGGTTFSKQRQVVTGVSRWISVSKTKLSLDPGEEKVVPFTIDVPFDATPGEHVAGLVVEAAPRDQATSDQGQVQFAVRVINRVGVAVVVNVAGPVPAAPVVALELTDLGLKEQGELGATLLVMVRNVGNVAAKGEGVLVISDHEGTELASIPFVMDTILAGDGTFFYVEHPVHLGDGKYLLGATLEYHAFRAEEILAAIPLLGIAIEVRDGQPHVPKVGQPTEPGQASEGLTVLTPAEEKGGDYAIYIYIAGLIAVMALLAALIVWRRRVGSAGHL